MARLSFTVVDPWQSERADLVMDADEETSVGMLSRHLTTVLGRSPRSDPATVDPAGHQAVGNLLFLVNKRRETEGSALFVNGLKLDPTLTLAQSPIVDGSVVSLGDDFGGDVVGDGVVELRIASGPMAGTVRRLALGEYLVGSASPASIVLDDEHLPAEALRVAVDFEGKCTATPLSGVPAVLEGESVHATVAWPEAGQLTIGSHLLEWHRPKGADAALMPSEDGTGLDYNRPPRILPAPRRTDFKLPMPPKAADRRPLQILSALMPVVMALSLAAMMQSPRYLLIGLLSPIMVIGSYRSDKKTSKSAHKERLAEYVEQRKQIISDAQEALRLERAERRQDFPDPAATYLIAIGPSSRLWERRRTDPDYLVLRFGTQEFPSEVTLEDPEQVEHRRVVRWSVPNAPVTVPLNVGGVLGIAGHGEIPRSLARWAVTQVATMHSPFDVQVQVLTDATGEQSWRWTQWLPHARPTMGQETVALIGTDADTVGRRIAELQQLLAARRKARKDPSAIGDGGRPELVVVLDGARRMRSLPGVVQLLKEGPEYGIYFICLDSDERLLPEECHAVVVEEWDGVRIQRQRTDIVRGARPDVVSSTWAERLARQLSPIRDVSGAEDAAALPMSSRLLSVLGLDPPTPEAVSARWWAGGRSTAAVIGETYDGPFSLDIRRDGPHGLIAGTTGAGKSELLQTLVAGLAVVNRPDSMTFVLVDYKGGSAFKDCVDLPHTVGMVTDLDTHLVERALESLGAELRRREHILAESGAKDIEDYQDLIEKRSSLVPVPRLLIVIDEFASMARELPDFVTGLVNIAQRGRSLGIHLILATQRPTGVVSPEIRANTNLRIALRVTDPAESSDVIDAPDAARIGKNTPGRGYARLGHASLVPFQSGRVGGRYPGAKVEVTVEPWSAPLRWADLAQPPPQRPKEAENKGDVEITDLKVLVDGIRGATEQLGIPPQHSPWLEALPPVLQLADVPEPVSGNDLPQIPFGIEDIPSEQAQVPACIDLAASSHVYFVGAPRSGRSQILRTVAAAAAARISPADLHLYGIDAGNGALLAMTDLPHCGAVVGRTQPERAIRLLNRVNGEVARRQELLAGGGYADVTEQRRGNPERALPHIVVMIDRWEGFVGSIGELDHGAYVDLTQKIMREGGSVGVHFFITGDRSLTVSRMAQLTEDKFVLRMVDKNDFSAFGINPRKVPDDIAAGRAFRAETFTEVQVAVLGLDLGGQSQAAELQRMGRELTEQYADVARPDRAFRIELMPKSITYAEAVQRIELPDRSQMYALFGVGGDDMVAMGPDLGRTSTFVIAGPAKSGRSTALLTMGTSLLESGSSLICVTPRSSPLRDLASHPGVVQVFDGPDLPNDELKAALAEASRPTVLLIDDAEGLKECDAASTLRSVIKNGFEQGIGLVAAGAGEDMGAGFSGWIPDLRRAKNGALLSPQSPNEADIIGVRLSRSVVGAQVHPGRAYLHLGDGTAVQVQVPSTTA